METPDPAPLPVVGDAEQVVRDREALRLGGGEAGEALRARVVEITAGRGPDIPGHRLLAPAEVVGGRDVAQHVEAELVAQVEARLDDARRIDDAGDLVERLARLDDSRDALVGHYSATPRISYAGGTPARIFSCSRTIPWRSSK